MEVFHGRGDIRSRHEVFTLLDAEIRNSWVEGNRQQADYKVRLTNHGLDDDLICHVDEYGGRVLMTTG